MKFMTMKMVMILEKQDGKVWTGIVWLKLGSSDGLW
jgi:hypothetical protein